MTLSHVARAAFLFLFIYFNFLVFFWSEKWEWIIRQSTTTLNHWGVLMGCLIGVTPCVSCSVSTTTPLKLPGCLNDVAHQCLQRRTNSSEALYNTELWYNGIKKCWALVQVNITMNRTLWHAGKAFMLLKTLTMAKRHQMTCELFH